VGRSCGRRGREHVDRRQLCGNSLFERSERLLKLRWDGGYRCGRE
jgi:hypothetical protein